MFLVDLVGVVTLVSPTNSIDPRSTSRIFIVQVPDLDVVGHGHWLTVRFYDTLQGEVLLDGRNIKELNVRWLRNQVGVHPRTGRRPSGVFEVSPGEDSGGSSICSIEQVSRLHFVTIASRCCSISLAGVAISHGWDLLLRPLDVSSAGASENHEATKRRNDETTKRRNDQMRKRRNDETIL